MFEVLLVSVATWFICWRVDQASRRNTLWMMSSMRISIAEFERRLRKQQLRSDEEVDALTKHLLIYCELLHSQWRVPSYDDFVRRNPPGP